ncbi:MAG TPA: glycosyltransferase [Thermoleophilaceae bacterium]|nr:glycosyltransferase [Thermoleophilaceae bacterium]
MLELTFVLHRRQNAFFGELVQVIRDELEALGVASSVSLDGYPEASDGRVYVLVPPHEWVALSGAVPPRDLMARTLVLCAEQPGSSFFEANQPVVEAAGAVFDISPMGVAEWRRRGIAAERFTLGHTVRWAAARLDAHRDVDVAFLGCASERRNRLLASYAPLLAGRNCRFILSDNARPNDGATPGFLVGSDKRALLRSTRVLLNLHVGKPSYFEHLRAVEAMLSGAVLVSEHGLGCEPFVPGSDMLCGRAESLGHMALELVDNDKWRALIQESALARLAEHPLSAAAERLAAAAAEVDRLAPPAPAGAWRPPHAAPPPVPQPQHTTSDPDAAATRRALKQLRLEGIETRRRIARLEANLAGGRRGSVEILERTPSYTAARPAVSVLLALFNHEHHVEEALESVARSSLKNVEIVVVDDGSEDGSAERVRSWLAEHPALPALLVGHRWNRGLPHARNTALDFARAPLSFVLDADNVLYRHGLRRLALAMRADESACFAYGILECFTSSGPTGLLSYVPWDPERLRWMNYVDAMALVRTARVRDVGGYAVDPRLHGWEDYDLWCAIAERGWHGAAVPEIVGRYRVAEHSMLRSTTQISNADAFSVLAERHPRLMAGVHLPS